MRNDLFTQVLDFSYVQIIKVPGEGYKFPSDAHFDEQLMGADT